MDYVAGDYGNERTLKIRYYEEYREKYPDILVLGGVWPKYYTPVTGSDLHSDLLQAMSRCDAVVVTGEGTGRVTPIDKIKEFKELLSISICSRHQPTNYDENCEICKSRTDFPLIVGAGLTVDNAYEQLRFADGAIVGTAMKINKKTINKVDRARVRDLMSVVKNIR